jgi:hypothetical protein
VKERESDDEQGSRCLTLNSLGKGYVKDRVVSILALDRGAWRSYARCGTALFVASLDVVGNRNREVMEM